MFFIIKRYDICNIYEKNGRWANNLPFSPVHDILKNMEKCTLCPVQCNVDRNSSVGRCKVGKLKIAKYGLHYFEEPCISFEKGAGTIFFCGCSLQCKFCQNFELSRNTRGKEITVDELVKIFHELEEMGAENIDLVSPSHYIKELVEAFQIYRPNIPIVYNSSGYEKIETLEKISPFVDVWLPDLKFYSPKIAERYTGRADYFEYASQAISFMAQKPIVIENKKMVSGTIVRHLILPLCSSDSVALLNFLAPMKDQIYLSIMSQYTPFGDIEGLPELKRRITAREYEKVLNHALDLGFENIFTQERESANTAYIPCWDY